MNDFDSIAGDPTLSLEELVSVAIRDPRSIVVRFDCHCGAQLATVVRTTRGCVWRARPPELGRSASVWAERDGSMNAGQDRRWTIHDQILEENSFPGLWAPLLLPEAPLELFGWCASHFARSANRDELLEAARRQAARGGMKPWRMKAAPTAQR